MEPEHSADVAVSDEVTFSSLKLSRRTLIGIQKCGFSKPLAIQVRALHLGRCGFDLIVEGKSGTGKTALFSIVTVERLKDDDDLQVIILAPAIETASQICHILKEIGSSFKDLSIESVMSSTDINNDILRLANKKYQILVGSPECVLHLIKVNAISTEAVRLVVLDEAEKFAEESFQKEIDYIFSQLPVQKQTIATSSTYTSELKEFLERHMKMPSHIKPCSSNSLLDVVQTFSIVRPNKSVVHQCRTKYDNLLSILYTVPFNRCLIFCCYQVRTEIVSELLDLEGWPVAKLATSQSQRDRLENIKKFEDFSCRILVTTNLASFEMNASNVDLVINFEIPSNITTYLHRINLSGGCGSKVMVITIAARGEEVHTFTNMINSLGGCNLVQFNKNLLNRDSMSNKLASEAHKKFISEVSKRSIFKFSKKPISKVPKKTLSEVSKESVSKFPLEPVSKVSTECISKVSRDSIYEVPKKPVSEVSKDTVSTVSKEPVSEVSKTAVSGV